MSDPPTQITRLSTRQPEPRTFVVRKAKLKVLSGPDDDQEIVLDGPETSIGTARDNTFVLSDATISRHHAVIQESAGGYLIKDLESTNGTELNNLRIREAYLEFGTTLTLGDTLLKFVPFEERIEVLPSADTRWGNVCAQSVQMRTLFAMLDKMADTSATIILQGETGTGKELFARAIHSKSPRNDQPFAVFDCGSVADNLIESELFGHKKGAFTGAAYDREGVFEHGNNGTVFLDEIGELGLDLQPKLLRVLENREVKRIGENRTVPVNVRVIAATHRDLAQEVKQGRFREDLYYRLSVIKVEIPPLRKRKEDIPLITEQILNDLSREFGMEKPPEISGDLFDILQAYHWPGNVRELRNVLSRAIALGDRTVVRPGHLLLTEQSKTNSTKVTLPEDMSLAEIEKTVILNTLKRLKGNKTRAARTLGIAYSTLFEKLKKHNIR